MNEPITLTTKQKVAVAKLAGVYHKDVEKVVAAINDVWLSDPPGTIRRRPDGTVLAVREADLNHPWKTWCPKGSASWMSDSITSWPVIYTPEAES